MNRPRDSFFDPPEGHGLVVYIESHTRDIRDRQRVVEEAIDDHVVDLGSSKIMVYM